MDRATSMRSEGAEHLAADSLHLIARGSWHPAIRREQSLSQAAAAAGIGVRFIAPRGDQPRSPAARLLHPDGETRMIGSITVVERGLELPSHRSDVIGGVNSHLIRRVLRPQRCEGTVVTYRPWEWAASRGAPRRVFDCVDDWPALLPDSAPLIRRWLGRIADEADEVIVVTEELADLFRGREVHVVPNAVDDHLLVPPVRPAPGNRRLLYLGSIGHRRLDLALIDALLSALPDWRLDLVGPSFLEDQSPTLVEIRRLEVRYEGRLRLLPAVDGRGVVEVIDDCDLMIAPFLPGVTSGQSSKKSFDAAARGRAIITSPGVSLGLDDVPPDQRVADGLDEWIEAIERGPSTTEVMARTRSWAQANSWSARFDTWAHPAMDLPTDRPTC